MDDSKKKKILIGAIVGSFIIVTLFAFLLFNSDEVNKDVANNKGKENNTPGTIDQAVNISNPDNQTNNNAESEEAQQTTEVVNELPFKEIVYEGNKYSLENGELLIDKNGQLLISQELLNDKLKLPVSWQDGVVYIGKQPVAGTEEVADFLSDMDTLRIYTDSTKDRFGGNTKVVRDQWEDSRPFSIAGTQYEKGIGFQIEYPNYAWGSVPIAFFADYNLAGKYETFKTEVGIDDEFKDAISEYVIRIYGDQKLLHESKRIRGGDFTLPIEIDVKNVIRLTIEADKIDEQEYKKDTKTKIVFTNPILK